MSKKSIKKILICIIAILMVVFVATKTFATDSNVILDKLNEMKQNTNNTTVKEDGNVQKIPEGEVENNTNKLENGLTTQEVNNTNKNNGNVAPTTTPYTGIGDYSTYVFIGIFAVSAIYAYKKIREN